MPPSNVTDQLAPAGRPVSAKVMEESVPKFAVTVPGALIVIVVVALVADAKTMELVEAVHATKT